MASVIGWPTRGRAGSLIFFIKTESSWRRSFRMITPTRADAWMRSQLSTTTMPRWWSIWLFR